MSSYWFDSPTGEAWDKIVLRLGGSAGLSVSARTHGAFRRARGIKKAEDLLRLVLAYGAGGRSLRMTAAQAAAHGIADVSDVALLGRFQRCAAWLTALCAQVLAKEDRPAGKPADPLIRLVDGSRLQGPGDTCWRLHLSYDPVHQRIADVAVTPLSTGEALGRLAVQPGEIRIADRGFPHPEGLRDTRYAGADVLVRLTWNSLQLQDTDGPLDWLGVFAQAEQKGGLDKPVWVHKARGRFTPLPMRLVVIPKPPQIAERARTIVRNTARKDQRRIDPRTVAAASYLILLTSLDAAAFPQESLAALYRVRWQVELVFKRLKSILHLDRLPAKHPDLVKTWIAANLLLALIVDECTAELADASP